MSNFVADLGSKHANASLLSFATTTHAHCSSTEQDAGSGDWRRRIGNVRPEGHIIVDRNFKEDMMPDQRERQNQNRERAGQQQGGGGQKPGQQQQQQPKQKPSRAGRQQQELDKKWREVAEPGQEPGTGQPGT